MNRILFGLNVVVLCVLSFLVRGNVQRANELRGWIDGSAAELPGNDIRMISSGARWRPEWIVDFGTDMVDDDEMAVSVGAVRLEPAVPVALRWLSKQALAIKPMKSLERARRYLVRVDHGMAALDGRRVPEHLDLQIETARPRLMALTVMDGNGEERPTIMATFDLPVSAGMLRKTLQVRSGEDVLPVEIDDVSSKGEHALAIRLGGAEALPHMVTVEVDGSMRAGVGDLPMGKTIAREVVLRESLRLTGAHADEHGIDLEFNRGVPLPDDGLVTITPPVPFQLVRRASGLRLLADLPAGQGVRVNLAAGFPGHGRVRAESLLERTVWIPNARPKLAFADAGRVLSSLAYPEIALTGVNVSRIEVTVRSVYANNLVRLSQESSKWSLPDAVFGPPRSSTLVLAASDNEPFAERLDLASLLEGTTCGIHEIRVRDLDGNAYGIWRLFQVTDLGVTVRATEGSVAIHVASLAKGIDVPDATVEVLTPTNQSLCMGTTDSEGIAVIDYERTAEDMHPYLVKVVKGDDLSYVDFRGFAVELATQAFGGRAPVGRIEAWVHPDRGVVRPGGMLRSVAVVRGLDGGTPVDEQLTVTWKDPSGRVRASSTAEVSVSGMLVLEHSTGAGAPTGTWRVELASGDVIVGDAAIRVEAFVPDRLVAEVVPVDDLVIGREGVVDIRGRWLEGSPAAGLTAKVFVRFDHGHWVPEGFEGYSFDDEAEKPPPGSRSPITAVLDGDGRARVRFAVPSNVRETQTLRARVSVELMDPSGRVVRADAIRDVLRGDFHIGLQVTESGAASVVAIDRNLGYVDVSEPVALDIVRRRWSWEQVARGSTWQFEMRQQSEVVDQKVVELDHGRAEIALSLPEAKRGWIVLVARCGSARVTARPGRAAERPDRLRVTGPGVPVRAGEPFEVFVDSPLAGRAFVTVEGRTVLAAHTAKIMRGRTKLVMTLEKDPVGPNVHVVATVRAPLARKSVIAAPFWIVGGTSIPVERSDRRVDVDVDIADRVLPESTFNVKVSAPGATEAHISVVDEGILSLTGHPLADPFGWFTAARRCVTRGADSGRSLITTSRFAPGVLVGGGGGLGEPRLRGSTSSLIVPLVLAQRITLDSEGIGTVRLKLPSYEGRVRVVVVAAGSNGVGAASRDVVVNGPVGLKIAMPRMLAPGDTSRVTVTVRNGTGGPGDVHLAASGLGSLTPVVTHPTVLALRAGETRSVDFVVRAGVSNSRSGLRLVASCGEHRREVTGWVVVRPPAIWAQERIGLVCEGRAEVVVPQDWLPGLRGQLVVHADPDARLLPALESLLCYPYGCVEQTTSRCRSLLACARLLPRLYGEEGTAPDADAMLQSGIDRLFSMQTLRGGLAWWPGGRSEYPFGTVYALDLLLDAKAAGLDVPPAPLERMIARTWRFLQTSDDPSLRAYAAEVVSRANRPVGPLIARLGEVVTRMEDRAHLAMALARGGEEASARGLIEALIDEPASAHESLGMLRSPLRSCAVELKARLVATPESPRIPVLAQRIVDALLRPGSLNTQELGRSIDALAAWYAITAGGSGFANAKVMVGGQTFPVEAGRPVSLPLTGGETVVVTCEGTLFGMLEIDGYRSGSEVSAGADIALTRRVVDIDTGKETTVFRRGGVYDVEISGRIKKSIENVLFTAVVPGGFEVERRKRSVRTRSGGALLPDRTEIRDDRVLLFVGDRLPETFRLVYRMRAVFPGTYQEAPLVLEALYEPGRRVGLDVGGAVEIAQ